MKYRSRILESCILVVVLFLIIPIVFLALGSIMGEDELLKCLNPIWGEKSGYAKMSFFPMYPTLRAYIRVLMDTPEYFIMFWNSAKITCGILLGQLICGTMAAWGLSKRKIPGKKVIMGIYIILMLMPFQVLMLSEYLVFERIHLLDTHLGIILQGSFATFPVFVIYQYFVNIPQEALEAAQLDGANEVQLFFYIGIPLGRNGIFSALVLSFFENWSMIEQPLTFLKSKQLWPLSILLPEITAGKIGFAFALSCLIFFPALFVFVLGQEYLERGISISVAEGEGIKR